MTLGTVVIRIIPKIDTSDLVQKLRAENYGVTTMTAEGKSGPVQVLFSIVKRKDLQDVLHILNTYNPHAFIQ